MDLAATLRAHLDRDGLVDVLRSLVRCPSVTGEEDAAQELVARRLRDLGAEVDVWSVDAEALRPLPGFPGARIPTSRRNVVGTLRGAASGPTLILNGHIDTVTPGAEERWSHPPFGGEVADGKLYGRGACDMKGGLAAALGALTALRRARLRLRGTVTLQSVIGEEDGGLGAFGALQRGHRGDAVIVCEPTRLAVIPAQAGVAVFRITVQGRAAHGCVRDEGVSAFERFLPVHAALQVLEERRNHTLRHPLYAGMALPWPLSIGLVRAGTWPAIVPEALTAEGRIGAAVGEPIAEVRRQLEEAVAGAAAADTWLAAHPPRVEWIGGVWESAETPADHPLVRLLGRGVEAATGRPAALRGAPYGSDLRLFTNDFKIPGVLFGPGDIRQAHFTDEHVPIAEVEAAALALAVTVAEFCGVA
jgi:acetylornithine deacetylase